MGKKVTETQNNFDSGNQVNDPQVYSDSVTLRDIMNVNVVNVVAVSPGESALAAAKKMADEKISCLVVTENDQIRGIVTNDDFVNKIISQNKSPDAVTVEQVMSGPITNLSENTPVNEAVRIFTEQQARFLPVVSDDKLVGIINRSDLFLAAGNAMRQRLEQANRQLATAPDQTSKDSQETVVADLAKSHFLANMSHEIRTPLNAIIGLSEVLAEEDLTEEQQGHLRIIRDSAQNMLDLINDILDFSKIETGKFSLDITECSLEHLLAVVESLMRPLAMQKNLEFGVSQKTDLPALIKTDPMRLRQCLANLINNAIDFTEKGHVHVNVYLKNIEGKDCVRFDVEDTGIGIAPQDQERIFHEFTQAAVVNNRKSGATGLGLTITKKLINLLGGSVSVKSELGKGSTFSIVLPVGLDVKAQPLFNKYDQLKRLRKEKKSGETFTLSGRILVAEDTPTNQTLIKLLLTRLGFEVEIAEDGKQALDMALNGDFDAILMDIQMPHMNGYDATRKLRQAGYKKPVIAVTAHAMRGDKEKCLAAGCDDYISKPINRQQLVEVLREYLGSEPQDVSRQLDAAASQVEQLSRMCEDAGRSSPAQQSTSEQNLRADELIDFQAVSEICGDPAVIKEVAKMFLKDSPRCIKSIAEAIKSANPKHIRMYAHSLKGASLQIGARKLAEFAYQLECAGRDKNMQDVPVLFNAVQDEYSRLTLFLSQPNWFEMARDSTQSQN
jgi:signal transduction histidine kinase/DNA-binding response OmpR family regulator